MNRAEIFEVRTDMAKQLAQKAGAMRKMVLDESLRYEGAVGSLAQVRDMLTGYQLTVRESFAEQGGDKEVCTGKMAILSAAIGSLDELAETAKAQLAGQRGKVQQAEVTLDMLQAVFAADITAAQSLIEDARPEGAKDTDGHPGPGVAAERRAEAEAGEGTDASHPRP